VEKPGAFKLELWVELNSTAVQPHLLRRLRSEELRNRLQPLRRRHVVALQVAFEKQTLKPVFQLIGFRSWV
jgi:hypothetical protein